MSAEIPTNIEVGLLGNLRKLLMLLPDSTVRRVVGQVLQHETLIAIAHNPSIIIRTAVIRVSPVYALLIQWNLRIKDTWGPEQVSFIQRCPLFGG